jgi:hypothetical protein
VNWFLSPDHDVLRNAFCLAAKKHLFFEDHIKTLFAAIRATKHADSVPALRERPSIVARIRAWEYVAEQKALQEGAGAKIDFTLVNASSNTLGIGKVPPSYPA